jgi:hypothetical protein
VNGVVAMVGVILMAATAGAGCAEPEPWLRPQKPGDPPMWGFETGIRIGLPPLPGPRGLIRIYHTQLGLPDRRVINYVAIEPIVGGKRGYSEMEHSDLDGTRGKRLWAAEAYSATPPKVRPAHETPGKIVHIESGGRQREVLELYIYVEPFDNGAQPVVRVRFHEGSPNEVEFALFAAAGGAKMDQCVLTATMGNYARLRNVQLKDRIVNSKDLWPDYRGDAFAPPKDFGARELSRIENGDYLVEAWPDEKDPAKATYAEGTSRGWKYPGRPAVQYWRRPDADPKPKNLECRLGARYCYWASKTPIPGGIAYENFELIEDYQEGVRQVFGVKPGER